MKKLPLTNEEVKQLLGVDDYGDITRDQIRIFVSEIPRIDKDVAIKAIEQFPDLADFTKEMVMKYNEISDKVIESNDTSAQRVLDAYENTLDIMSALAQRDGISFDERQWFAVKAVEIADRMAEFDKENKGFLRDVLKFGSWIVGGGIALCAAILGFSFYNSKDD